mgnify:CR=1 FL=1
MEFGIYLGRQCHLYSRADGGQHGYGGYGLQAILPVHGHRLRHRSILYVLDGHSELRLGLPCTVAISRAYGVRGSSFLVSS